MSEGKRENMIFEVFGGRLRMDGIFGINSLLCFRLSRNRGKTLKFYDGNNLAQRNWPAPE